MNQDILDKIDDYFLGNLTKEACDALMHQVANSEVTKAAFDLRRLEHESLNLMLEEDLRIEFEKWDREDKNNTTTLKNRSMRKWLIPLAIAASMGLLVGFFLNAGRSPDYPAIANNYYEINFSSLRSADQETHAFDDVKNILANKLDEHYGRLEKVLTTISADNTNYSIAQYYLGHLFYVKKQYEQSIIAFSNIPKEADEWAAGQWYTALAQLQQRNNDDATRVLRSIEQASNSPYQFQAKKLLEDLN